MARILALSYLLTCYEAAHALDNGLALTPIMGFNSYMSGLHGEAGLGKIADFFTSSGLHRSGYEYVNTDEGWETKTRSASGQLQWSETQYPSGLPQFISRLHGMGLKYGIYGASSGVTCGQDPGQLYFEDNDAATYARWGVDYLKSDNCASYALDSSVRFGAMRDALNRTGRRIVHSIEPFSMTPDPEQSVLVSNLARVATDISGNFGAFTDRADISDKWSPLARPGYWNDPDMINLKNSPQFSLGENRLYFGLWAIMKAPLLLSADLTQLDPAVIAIINNTAVIAVNQDPLGVQARKLAIDDAPLPWLVGLESCRGSNPVDFYSRGLEKSNSLDTRTWTTIASEGTNNTFLLKNDATDRCLMAIPWSSVSNVARPEGGGTDYTVALLPCNSSSSAQQWLFDKGSTTVTSVTNVEIRKSLAVSNATLFSRPHGNDEFSVSDAAYGYSGLVFITPFDQSSCTSRNCQNYDPSQMWFYSANEKKLRQSTYVASINHKEIGEGYQLTQKVPTWQHHCLAHVLSVSNTGTVSGDTEVWGGPLRDGFVAALVNRGSRPANITMRYSFLGVNALKQGSTLEVQSLWDGQSLGDKTDSFQVEIPAHDMGIFQLSTPTTSLVV